MTDPLNLPSKTSNQTIEAPPPRSLPAMLGWAVIGLLVLGLLTLRCRTAVTRGIFQFDEAYYLLEAKTIRIAFEQAPNFLSGHLSLAEFKTRQMAAGTLFPPGKATPIYVLMVILLALFPIQMTTAGNLVSALSTLPASLALYLGARALKVSKADAILLAVLFFVSPIVTYYGVSSLPHALAAMFYLFSLAAILRGSFIRAGLWLGLTLTTHYGMLPSVLLCLPWLAFEIAFSRDSWKTKRRQALCAFVLFLSPLLALESVYQFVRWKFSAYWTDIHYHTYLEQLFKQVFVNTPKGQADVSNLRRNVLVFEGFFKTQGLELTLLMLASLTALWLRSKFLDRRARGLLLVTTILPLFWLLNPGYIASRVVMFILPGFFMMLACMIGYLQHENPWRPRVVHIVLVCLIVLSSIRSVQISKSLRSPYPDALRYLEGTGYQGPVVDPSNTLTWQYYLGRRVDFEKGYHINFETVKNHVFKLLEAPQAPRELPFFMLTQWDWDAYGPGMAALHRHLSSRGPVHTWPLPYAHLEIYHYEDYYAGVPKDEDLQMYWISKKDFAGITP